MVTGVEPVVATETITGISQSGVAARHCPHLEAAAPAAMHTKDAAWRTPDTWDAARRICVDGSDLFKVRRE